MKKSLFLLVTIFCAYMVIALILTTPWIWWDTGNFWPSYAGEIILIPIFFLLFIYAIYKFVNSDANDDLIFLFFKAKFKKADIKNKLDDAKNKLRDELNNNE
jgi:hypothetical protein